MNEDCSVFASRFIDLNAMSLVSFCLETVHSLAILTYRLRLWHKMA